MSEKERLSARLVRPLAMGMRFQGRDPDAVLRRAGIDPEVLGDAAAWLPLQAVLDCWKAVEDGPPHFGLLLSERIDFKLLVLLESAMDYLLVQLIVSSADVAEATEMIERYSGITFGHLRFTVERDATGRLLRFAGREGQRLPREFVNFALTFPLRAIQTAAAPVVPTAIFLPYPSPSDLTTHTRVFKGAPLHFNAGTAAFRIPARDLATPMGAANPTLMPSLRAKADTLMEELARVGTFSLEIRELIRKALRKGDVSATLIAQHAGVSLRMLSRRLDAQGASYRALVDEVRQEVAEELLRDPRLSLADIAAEVGFADLSSFQRAFRRWSGMSPGQFRETNTQPAVRLR